MLVAGGVSSSVKEGKSIDIGGLGCNLTVSAKISQIFHVSMDLSLVEIV